MNYYLFLPLGSILINVFAWSYIYAQKQDTAVNKTLFDFLGQPFGMGFLRFYCLDADAAIIESPDL